MRLIRTVAACLAILLGLACVSLAAFGSSAVKSVTSAASPTPDKSETPRSLPPLDPEAGNAETRMVNTNPLGNPFANEFGQRGRHEVEVTITGGAGYFVSWRGGGGTKMGVGGFTDKRTVDGGFPLVQTIIGKGATCVVTIDGIEKDRQASTPEKEVQVCEA